MKEKIEYLYNKIKEEKENAKNYGINIENSIPDFVINNINKKLRYYQKEAIENFIYTYKVYKDNDRITKKLFGESFDSSINNLDLLYQMATGSGKTLIMASLILYLWTKGYRNFIYIVNRKYLIEKTKDNLYYEKQTKYLFNKVIKNNDKRIKVKMVDSFQDKTDENINISFISIQQLTENIKSPRENNFTLNDFSSKKIVFICDEAHHNNKDVWSNIL